MIRGLPPYASRRRAVVTGTVALLAFAAAGCANDAAPAATPAGEPTRASETTSPERATAPVGAPTVTPVVGERIPAAHWVNSSSLLTHREAATGSGDAVLPMVHAVGDWLDAHLDDLQHGGPGLLDDVAAPGLLDAAEPTAITVDLAGEDRPVASARYLLEGSYDATAEWLEATVEVTHTDGTVALATLVFTATGDPADPIQLVLYGSTAQGIPS